MVDGARAAAAVGDAASRFGKRRGHDPRVLLGTATNTLTLIAPFHARWGASNAHWGAFWPLDEGGVSCQVNWALLKRVVCSRPGWLARGGGAGGMGGGGGGGGGGEGGAARSMMSA